MIRLRLALLVLFTVLRLNAATVTGLVQNITLEAPTNAPMVFAPTANPSYDNGRLTTDTAKGVRVGSNGSFRADLAAGEYLLTIGTSTKRVKFTVPPGTETYDLMVLVTNTPFSTNIPATPFELKANKGVANGYASLGSDGLVPADQLPAGNSGGGGVGSFYTNNILATSSATQLGATNGSNTVVSAIVSGSRVTFTFNARPATVSAGNGIFVTNVGGSNFIVAGSITAAEFTALTNAVAGLTNLVAAKEGTNNSTRFGYLRMPGTNDYLDFNQTWNIRRYADDTLHFDYPDTAASPLIIRPNGITVSNIYIPGTNVFIQWNGTWSLVAWADGSFRLLNDDTGTTPFSVATDGTVTAPAFVGDGSGLTGLPGLSGLAELHFENESGSPTPGDAIVFRSGGRIWIQNVGGSQTDLEGVATTAATAASLAATKQTGSAVLTGITGTGAITNLVNGSTNGSGWVGLIRSTNNGNAVLKTLSAGLYLVMTNQGTNVVYALDWSTLTNGILGLLSNGVPLITTDGLVFNYLTVSNWAYFVGKVTNASDFYLPGITGSGAHLTIDADGKVTRTTISSGGTATFQTTNMIATATNNIVWDAGNFPNGVLWGLTNLNRLIVSNLSNPAYLSYQEDTNGTREVNFVYWSGPLLTNALKSLRPGTNANTVTTYKFLPLGTNAQAACWETNIAGVPFTNSLASSGGGGGGGSCPDDASPSVSQDGVSALAVLNRDNAFGGQLWNDSTTRTLCKVGFKLKAYGNITGRTLNVRVFTETTANDIDPNSPVASSDNVTGNNSWNDTWVYFTFSSDVTLTANTDYGIVLDMDGDNSGTDMIEMKYNASGTIPGNAVLYNAAGIDFPASGDAAIKLYFK